MTIDLRYLSELKPLSIPTARDPRQTVDSNTDRVQQVYNKVIGLEGDQFQTSLQEVFHYSEAALANGHQESLATLRQIKAGDYSAHHHTGHEAKIAIFNEAKNLTDEVEKLSSAWKGLSLEEYSALALLGEKKDNLLQRTIERDAQGRETPGRTQAVQLEPPLVDALANFPQIYTAHQAGNAPSNLEVIIEVTSVLAGFLEDFSNQGLVTSCWNYLFKKSIPSQKEVVDVAKRLLPCIECLLLADGVGGEQGGLGQQILRLKSALGQAQVIEVDQQYAERFALRNSIGGWSGELQTITTGVTSIGADLRATPGSQYDLDVARISGLFAAKKEENSSWFSRKNYGEGVLAEESMQMRESLKAYWKARADRIQALYFRREFVENYLELQTGIRISVPRGRIQTEITSAQYDAQIQELKKAEHAHRSFIQMDGELLAHLVRDQQIDLDTAEEYAGLYSVLADHDQDATKAVNCLQNEIKARKAAFIDKRIFGYPAGKVVGVAAIVAGAFIAYSAFSQRSS